MLACFYTIIHSNCPYRCAQGRQLKDERSPYTSSTSNPGKSRNPTTPHLSTPLISIMLYFENLNVLKGILIHSEEEGGGGGKEGGYTRYCCMPPNTFKNFSCRSKRAFLPRPFFLVVSSSDICCVHNPLPPLQVQHRSNCTVFYMIFSVQYKLFINVRLKGPRRRSAHRFLFLISRDLLHAAIYQDLSAIHSR